MVVTGNSFCPCPSYTQVRNEEFLSGCFSTFFPYFFVHFPCLPSRFFSSLRNGRRKFRSTSRPFVMNIHKLLPERVCSSVDSLHMIVGSLHTIARELRTIVFTLHAIVCRPHTIVRPLHTLVICSIRSNAACIRSYAACIRLYAACMQAAFYDRMQAACIPSVAPALYAVHATWPMQPYFNSQCQHGIDH